MKIERFEDIEAWQLVRELTLKVYKLKIITSWLDEPELRFVDSSATS